MPCYQHTFSKNLSSPKHRLEMTKLAVKNVDCADVSTLEIDHKLDGNTINVIPILKKKFLQHEFSYIIGSDQLKTFEKWGRWEDLLEAISFVVVPRLGEKIEVLYKSMKAITGSLFVQINISSSLVRERVKKGLSVRCMADKEVERYIYKKGLYLF